MTNASRVAAEKVLFYTSDPTWTVPDLATLVEAVRDAIQRKDIAKLRRYQARVNFSAEGWDQAAPSEEVPEEFAIGNYLASSNPRVDERARPHLERPRSVAAHHELELPPDDLVPVLPPHRFPRQARRERPVGVGGHQVRRSAALMVSR